MSDVYFVNYSSGSFIKNRKWNNFFIRLFVRPRRLLSLTDQDLKESSIYSANRTVFDSPRGGGYWAWKPWAILQAFDVAKEGDVIIYQDCGTGVRYKNFINPTKVISLARENGQVAGVAIPELGPNKKWTKKSCFEEMGCVDDIYKDSSQIEATTSFWVVNSENRRVLEKWLGYCLDLKVVSDVTDRSLEEKYFIEHRHDQSILTNLIYKNNLYYIKQNIGVCNLFKGIWVQELFLRRHNWIFSFLWLVMIKLRYLRG